MQNLLTKSSSTLSTAPFFAQCVSFHVGDLICLIYLKMFRFNLVSLAPSTITYQNLIPVVYAENLHRSVYGSKPLYPVATYYKPGEIVTTTITVIIIVIITAIIQ